MRNVSLVLLALVLVGAGLAAWAFWYEPASLKTSEVTVELSDWPNTCNGLRVVVLADLHVGSPYNDLEKLATIVRSTNATDPDIVLLAGDYVIQGVIGGNFITPEAAAKVLSRLTPAHGTYAVLGNHDWWLDAQAVDLALSTQGITVLEDRSQKLTVDDCVFHLVGISDYWEGAHDIERAFSEVPVNAAVLSFTHNPDIFPQIDKRFSLLIAGHTHGGQVYIPGVGRPIVPSDFGSRYAIGHVVEQGNHLYVSSGVGTSIIPVRFMVPPEITVLNLHKAGE